MSADIPSHARVSLSKLLHAIQSNASAGALITAAQQHKCSTRQLQKFLNDFTRVDASAGHAYTGCFHDPAMLTKPPIECLRQFLHLYEEHRRGKRGVCKPNVETIAEEESPSMWPANETVASTVQLAQANGTQVAAAAAAAAKTGAGGTMPAPVGQAVARAPQAAPAKAQPTKTSSAAGHTGPVLSARSSAGEARTASAQVAAIARARSLDIHSNGTRANPAQLTRAHSVQAVDSSPTDQPQATTAPTASTPTTTTTATPPLLPKAAKSPSPPPPYPSTDVSSRNLAEIMKKVQIAATDGLSRSAHTSMVAGGGDTSACSPLAAAASHFDANLRLYAKWYHTADHAKSDKILIASPQKCGALPLDHQQRLIIADLLACFVGLPGVYIVPKPERRDAAGRFQPIEFAIAAQIDVSLRDIAHECLPMASHYSNVQKFVQWAEARPNQVLNALSEVLQDLLADYRASVCQLEWDESLSLQRLAFMIRPNAQMLQQLYELVGKVAEYGWSAGRILTLLYGEITLQTGDPRTQRLLIEVTERAAQPLIAMLEQWLLKGVICDPYEQFFVVDHGDALELQSLEGFDTARYWESRYTVQRDRVPCFLEPDADIILRTGKYLNVIRQCGRQIEADGGGGGSGGRLQFSATALTHSAFVKQAYYKASKTLLDLLVTDNNLMAHITSVKRYFLLQQGDLITQFMDASEEELSKHVDKVTPVRLDNLLQLIVRLSSAKHDPCLEHLHCDLFTVGLLEQMSKIHEAGNQSGINLNPAAAAAADAEHLTLSGLECFAFKYTVQWPVSVVLNQWTLSQYQILFRLLFYCKHIEHQLSKVWKMHCELGKKSTKAQNAQWRAAVALRLRMLNAIQHVENYMMSEVIEQNWHVFTQKMRAVKNVDEVMAIHNDFLHVCLQNCMLENPELLSSFVGIGTVCAAFCRFMQALKSVQLSAGELQQINEFGAEFDAHLIRLLSDINGMSAEHSAGVKLLNLVHRINFNGFYSKALEQADVRGATE